MVLLQAIIEVFVGSMLHLVASPDPERGTPYSALRFFGTVSRACQLALNLFKELEREDPIIHRKLCVSVFGEQTSRSKWRDCQTMRD
ncbi:hypothetical protein KSB_62010 [Ktedonobacter robiniae]|uniref:Uncharacterized protein n=2 Tax=Ktedonobacter robiniae TaxID=2778365 RepID=A0ABQ3UXX8_9CHLR|nr:hypothetical protein KSB_62010 [Ktedonobacter robiniae]